MDELDPPGSDGDGEREDGDSNDDDDDDDCITPFKPVLKVGTATIAHPLQAGVEGEDGDNCIPPSSRRRRRPWDTTG